MTSFRIISSELKESRPLVQGVVVPLVTPVTPSGDIDFAGMAHLAQWLVSMGIDGLFVGGTTGRFSHFTPQKIADACRVVADAVGRRATIYGGICDSGLHRILSNADLMKAAGADFAVTTGPYYLPRLIGEVEMELEEVADRAAIPLVLYNLPEFVGYSLRPEWVGEIANHPNVLGYKDSSNDPEHLQGVLKRTLGADFSVLIGKELLLAEALRLGAKGIVVSLVHVNPALFVSLMRDVAHERWDAVNAAQPAVQRIVEDLMVRMRKRPAFSTLLHYLEDQLRRQGIDVTLI